MQKIESFFLCLSVCHTVMAKPAEGDPNDPFVWNKKNTVYQASSPDEHALVIGAKGSGFWFKRRQHTQLTVEVDGEAEPRIFEVLNICEFNSTRKRMSVLVKMPDKTLMLMCKGADSVIFERLRFVSECIFLRACE